MNTFFIIYCINNLCVHTTVAENVEYWYDMKHSKIEMHCGRSIAVFVVAIPTTYMQVTRLIAILEMHCTVSQYSKLSEISVYKLRSYFFLSLPHAYRVIRFIQPTTVNIVHATYSSFSLYVTAAILEEL